ncbi:MAG: tail fiber domain-containing protein [Synechococcus sp.]
MSTRNRTSLKEEFKDGERPSGRDFADLIDSFLNIQEDGLSVDPVEQDLLLPRGLQLGNSERVTAAGTLRFTGTQVQYSNGSAWVSLASGSGGAFQSVGDSDAVAYDRGNVGIGSGFTAAEPPTYRLEVPLGRNTGTEEQVRFGNAVCSNGQGAFQNYAYFAHRGHATNTAYGFRQGENGNVHLNAPADQPLSIRQNGNSVRLGITAVDGHVVVGSETDLGDEISRALDPEFQVRGSAFVSDTLGVRNDLLVAGDAQKPGGGVWSELSDIRVKEDIRDLDVGLDELMQVRPVRFRYNGKAGTPKGKESIGIIGQEIETIFPEMVRPLPNADGIASDDEPLRIYNGSALTYVLVNAVKELTGRVAELEGTIAKLQQAPYSQDEYK